MRFQSAKTQHLESSRSGSLYPEEVLLKPDEQTIAEGDMDKLDCFIS
ncbi:hypothetical protein [Enterobacter asburiae]